MAEQQQQEESQPFGPIDVAVLWDNAQFLKFIETFRLEFLKNAKRAIAQLEDLLDAWRNTRKPPNGNVAHCHFMLATFATQNAECETAAFHFRAATRMCDMVLERSPPADPYMPLRLRLSYGIYQYSIGNSKRAQRLLNDVIENAIHLHVRNVRSAHLFRGLVLRALHEPQAALDDFEAAILLNPADSWKLHLYSAMALCDLQKYDKAKAAIAEAEKQAACNPMEAAIVRARACGTNVQAAWKCVEPWYIMDNTARKKGSILLLRVLALRKELKEEEIADLLQQAMMGVNEDADGLLPEEEAIRVEWRRYLSFE